MSTFRCSAPGKLYLFGEYAVLDGGLALVRAVDRRVNVTFSEASSGWSLTAPELGIDHLALGADATLPDGLSDTHAKQLRLFNEVRTVVNILAPATASFDIAIESSQFIQDGHKLGLGSSAAVAVALTAAFAAGRGVHLTPFNLFLLAANAHSAAQDGKGSGGDVAASVFGGHILYRKGFTPERVNWPNDLKLFAVVTGTGSSTVDLVSRVGDYAAENPTQYRADIDRLKLLAERTSEALTSAKGMLLLADEYFRGVQILDSHAHAGIVTDRHRELRRFAASSAAVFKPSGAGGGDLGLVFAKLDSTDRLSSVFTEAGALVIPVPHSPDGVRRETP